MDEALLTLIQFHVFIPAKNLAHKNWMSIVVINTSFSHKLKILYLKHWGDNGDIQQPDFGFIDSKSHSSRKKKLS